MPARPCWLRRIRATSSTSIAIQPVLRSIPAPTTRSSARRARSRNEPLYADGRVPDAGEIAARRAGYYDPYHALLAAELERVRVRHGHAILLDGHSIRSEVPRFFAGRLPDLNLGTADGASCAPSVQAAADIVLAGTGAFTSVVNGRFKGGHVTRRYGAPARSVHALQLEMAQACYMDEAPPFPWNATRAAPLVDGAPAARRGTPRLA